MSYFQSTYNYITVHIFFQAVKQWVDTMDTWQAGIPEYHQDMTCVSAAVVRYNSYQINDVLLVT